jgi:hypothetical protein
MKREFKNWYTKTSKKTGGLINNTTASKIKNISKARISQISKEGKLKIYKFNESDKNGYIGLNDLLNL